MRLLHYSDIENVYDRPERAGRLAGLLEAYRDDETIVVGTGDDLGPSVLSMETDGRQSLDFFRAVAPDVETFGNHDFDYGLDATRKIVRESPQVWTSANVRESAETARETADEVRVGERFADAAPTTVVERGGESVGFAGVTDPESSVPDSLTVTDPVEAVREATDDLRDRGVDRVVALAHVPDRRLRDVAAVPGVDAVLAGHVHGERRDRIEGTLVVRPGANGRVVWEVELGETVEAARLETADAPVDETVAERLRDRMAATGLAEVVGRATVPIERERREWFAGERRVTNFVADAYRWATGADASFFDAAMLREGPPLSGEVTVADLRGLAPFAADLRVASVSGETLGTLVEEAVLTDERADRVAGEELWWGHFAGMAVVWDRDAEAVREIRVDGEPLDPEAEYSLATTGYVLWSDEFPAVSLADAEEAWGVQYDALVEYARAVGVRAELDGRIEVAE
ncbi:MULTISPECIES: bifunctional metallophosphatase/5'-nucleotidase [Halorussus]|uniref:bifunctional metallophosphatase/5'-nucleotidase n=1 Tax=Halorussus TaxID=1070314 RepID=UPI00209C8677|nr:5'-nucleotidase C-terminal domain-containing protein [Halorussus vallis]USZ76398.1 5'-nucleotidase C-terminal domain-containing protein [Halorussus vallis]